MKCASARVCRKCECQQLRRFLYQPLSSLGVVILLFSLSMLLSACNPFAPPAHGTGTPVAIPPASPTVLVTPARTATPTPPTISLQVVNCPSLSINWDSLVGTKAQINKVQKVICGTITAGVMSALVDVRYYSPDAKLDYYVYDNLNGTPNRRFAMQGLIDGDAEISPTNTLITAEVGPNSVLKGAPDLYKEYQWNGSTFAQILFPGMYPDMTHFQAERDQALVAQGFNTWKSQAYSVVYNLATKVFHWPNITAKTVTYSNTSGIYNFSVTNLGAGGGGFIVSLFHLDGVVTNIFEVKQVTSIDGTAQLASPAIGVSLTSPVTVSGSALVSGTVVGRVLVYDNTLTIVGDSGAISSPTSSGSVNFTRSISYTLNARGSQEGAVALYTTNQSNDAITNQVIMVKVFLSA